LEEVAMRSRAHVSPYSGIVLKITVFFSRSFRLLVLGTVIVLVGPLARHPTSLASTALANRRCSNLVERVRLPSPKCQRKLVLPIRQQLQLDAASCGSGGDDCANRGRAVTRYDSGRSSSSYPRIVAHSTLPPGDEEKG